MSEDGGESKPRPVVPIPPDLLEELVKHAHSATTIWGASVLDKRLGELLARYLPNLSNTLREKLFDGYGPFSSFSSRIDVLFALGQIDGPLRGDLHTMRDIRNYFAHSSERATLRDDEPNKLLRKLSTFKPVKDPLAIYLDAIDKCSTALAPTEERMAMVKALRDYSAKHGSPLEPSADTSPHPTRPSPGGSDTDGEEPPRS